MNKSGKLFLTRGCLASKAPEFELSNSKASALWMCNATQGNFPGTSEPQLPPAWKAGLTAAALPTGQDAESSNSTWDLTRPSTVSEGGRKALLFGFGILMGALVPILGQTQS